MSEAKARYQLNSSNWRILAKHSRHGMLDRGRRREYHAYGIAVTDQLPLKSRNRMLALLYRMGARNFPGRFLLCQESFPPRVCRPTVSIETLSKTRHFPVRVSASASVSVATGRTTRSQQIDRTGNKCPSAAPLAGAGDVGSIGDQRPKTAGRILPTIWMKFAGLTRIWADRRVFAEGRKTSKL